MDKILMLSIVYILLLLVIIMLDSNVLVKFTVLIVILVGVFSSVMYYKYKVRCK